MINQSLRLEWSFQESWINYNSPRKAQRCVSTRWILEKINAKDKTFSKSEHRVKQQSSDELSNETQAIDSEKQFIENKVKIKFKL